MISWAQRPSSAAAISAISGAIFSASLRTGTTMDTATPAGSGEGKSALVVWGGLRTGLWPAFPGRHHGDRFLWGESAPGNPFGGPRLPWRDGTALTDDESQTAGREPVPDQHRTGQSDHRTSNHIARMMGQKHQPAGGDQQRIH